MTIGTFSDDETFEQIKKQLNRMVEVIRVLDFTNVSVHMKEILYVKVLDCSPEDKTELFQIAETFKAQVIDYGKDSLLLEFFQTSGKNDSVVRLMKKEFHHIEVVRGGSVGIESISYDRPVNKHKKSAASLSGRKLQRSFLCVLFAFHGVDCQTAVERSEPYPAGCFPVQNLHASEFGTTRNRQARSPDCTSRKPAPLLLFQKEEVGDLHGDHRCEDGTDEVEEICDVIHRITRWLPPYR